MSIPGEDLSAFEADAIRFLETHHPLRPDRATTWGVGSDEVPTIDDPSHEEELRDLAAARRWRATLCDHGYGWLHGPRDCGGAGLPPEFARAFAALESRYDTPRLDTLLVSLRIVVPALAVHGTEAQKQELLIPLLRGDLVSCQLFSEPEAGSDLASVRTRARRDGDRWVIDGQKVWTSGAHYSHVGLLLARTDPDVAKHAGLTMFLIDMNQPGVVVRPLRQMTGGSHFNEVFLEGVSVDDSRRVGAVNGGWAVAVTTLMGEREAVGDSKDAPASVVVDLLTRLWRELSSRGEPVSPALRDEVAGLAALGAVAEWTNQRLVEDAVRRGGAGPEMSMAKLLRNRLVHRAISTAGSLLGPRAVADTGEWGTYAWARAALNAPGMRLGGGTDEIQLNILAERVLQLPR